MLFLHQNIITKTSFMCDLIISHGSAWPRGTLPTFLHFMSCQQAASGVTPSERERCLTWISFIALTSPAAAKTARSYCRRSALWKNNSGRSWYKYMSSCSRPPKLFMCVYFLFGAPVFAVQRLPLFVMVLQNSSAECEVLGYRKWGCSLTWALW